MGISMVTMTAAEDGGCSRLRLGFGKEEPTRLQEYAIGGRVGRRPVSRGRVGQR